jgi:hypothetical protein
MGVTHTDPNDKFEVSFVVVFVEENESIDFLVDVVQQNDAASVFFHDKYSISATFETAGKGSKDSKLCRKGGKRGKKF